MTSPIKRFPEWINLKERLHHREHKPPLVSEQDIWWVSFGENVGSEINGKSGLFSRPAIIFRKLAHGFYFVIPATTRIKKGSWFVPFTYEGRLVTACLHQARALDHRRLSNRLGTVSNDDFARLRDGFAKLYIKNFPRSGERGRG